MSEKRLTGRIARENIRHMQVPRPPQGVIEGFRWCLLGAGTPPGASMAASVLAEAGARVAALLVEINLGATGEDDPRVRHARTLVAVAREASERAFGAVK